MLIDVLAFSYEYADHVQVTILTGSPDMLESLLARIALAQIEGEFVLSRADFSEDVVVGLPFQKRVADARMAIVCCIVQGSPLAMILSINVCTALEKHQACV